MTEISSDNVFLLFNKGTTGYFKEYKTINFHDSRRGTKFSRGGGSKFFRGGGGVQIPYSYRVL